MNPQRQLKSRERGSALLVSLMVIAGLSLLGLGFVAISETESAISVNERNYTQALQVAEAGARTVAEWFNAPEWALANGIMPANSNSIKQQRENATYTGFYKSDITTDLLFDVPFSSDDDRFYGADPKSADIVITRTNAATFLDTFNAHLFRDNTEGGRVIEIRVYGPPVIAGTTTTTAGGLKFWNSSVGRRYGLATIAVTAEKTRDGSVGGQVVARRTVRIVVSELPLPGADGPLQSGTGTSTQGNFRVHWGKTITNGNMSLKRLHTSLPWHNAWTRVRFEEGYAPSYDTAAPDYLYELIDKSFMDPWFEAGARGTSTKPPGFPSVSGSLNQLWLYSSPNDVETAGEESTGPNSSGLSGHFQNQTHDEWPLKRTVLFTRPAYEVWKQIALAGAGQQGIYYLRRVPNDMTGSGASMWEDTTGVRKRWDEWVNIHKGGNEGFFFFETLDGTNPQLESPPGATNTAVLTPALKVQSNSAVNEKFVMRGFFYMNMATWGTTGLKNAGAYYNYPGEPFQDIGVHLANAAGQLLCTVTGNPTPQPCVNHAGAPPHVVNFTNREWNYQDLNGNGRFDYFVKPNAADIVTPGTDSPDFAAGTRYFVEPYNDACGIGGLGTACSEPHEPYLNLIYPYPMAIGAPHPVTGVASDHPHGVVVRWEAPGTMTRRPKKQTAGVPVTCTTTPDTSGGSSNADCTSNGYDRVGPLVQLKAGDADGAILEGIIYNEGGYDGSGNAIFYGALLFQGEITGSGTPYVFFDESLTRGDWHKKFKNMPRTIMTTIETDQ